MPAFQSALVKVVPKWPAGEGGALIISRWLCLAAAGALGGCGLAAALGGGPVGAPLGLGVACGVSLILC